VDRTGDQRGFSVRPKVEKKGAFLPAKEEAYIRSQLDRRNRSIL
jgi:hypothetical protein